MSDKSWINESIIAGLNRPSIMDERKELLKRVIDACLYDGLKTSDEIKAFYYGQSTGDLRVLKMMPLSFLWIDEYMAELGEGSK